MKEHKDIIESLSNTWNLFLKLNPENLHPDTQRDFCNGIHNLQRIIATEAAFVGMPYLFNESPLPLEKPKVRKVVTEPVPPQRKKGVFLSWLKPF